MSLHRLLVIGADSVGQESGMSLLLGEDKGFGVERVAWSDLRMERLRNSQAHIVLAMIGLEDESTAKFMASLREHPLQIPIFAIFTSAASQMELRSIAEIVDDFVVLPARLTEIECRLRRMLRPPPSEAEELRAKLAKERGLAQIVTQSPAFLKVISLIPKIAASEAAVLITGETGVGKELCARAIHHLSARQNHSFIPMDCAALPETLMENEIFGHVRGAFTGAQGPQKGLVALAEKGTLFLDEIDSLTLSAQAKLLRLLQEHCYRPLGGDRFCQSDARVIAATNGNLDQLIKEARFRRDLYYRLDMLHLHIPALRERPGDIIFLARRALDSVELCSGGPPKRLSSSAIRKLEAHNWPGNVRELLNVVQRAAILCDAPELRPEDIVLGFDAAEAGPGQNITKFRERRAQAIESFEKTYVAELMEKHRGNVTRAAIEAGKDRRAFGRLVGKYLPERGQPNRGIRQPPLGQI